MTRLSLCILLSLTLLVSSTSSLARELKIPELGNASSSTVSLQQEYALGQYWMRAFYQQATVFNDPLLYTYLQDLIQNLAFYSQMKEKHFNLILVDDRSFNAFAVPGHIIGVHSGLFSFADTEDQLASVLTHELAHLSQRHYARSVESAKQRNMLTLAGLLGGLLLAVAGGGEAGFAAISATQAAAISDQLKYSRLHEQEADRIGIQNLAKAGMNPEAMAQMFQHLLVLTRYRTDLKDFDFLLTHPVTDSRVSDAMNLAKQFPKSKDRDSFQFHLMKARVYMAYSKNAQSAENHFRQQLGSTKYESAARYGLALTFMEQKKWGDAKNIIDELYQEQPNNTAFQAAKIDLLSKQEQWEEAIDLANKHLRITPNHFALSLQLAKIYEQLKAYSNAADVLRSLSQSTWATLPEVWYELAEMEGMAGNILGVHLARAEYYERIGAFAPAQKHLLEARKMAGENLLLTSRIEVRQQEIERMRKDNPFR